MYNTVVRYDDSCRNGSRNIVMTSPVRISPTSRFHVAPRFGVELLSLEELDRRELVCVFEAEKSIWPVPLELELGILPDWLVEAQTALGNRWDYRVPVSVDLGQIHREFCELDDVADYKSFASRFGLLRTAASEKLLPDPTHFVDPHLPRPSFQIPDRTPVPEVLAVYAREEDVVSSPTIEADPVASWTNLVSRLRIAQKLLKLYPKMETRSAVPLGGIEHYCFGLNGWDWYVLGEQKGLLFDVALRPPGTGTSPYELVHLHTVPRAMRDYPARASAIAWSHVSGMVNSALTNLTVIEMRFGPSLEVAPKCLAGALVLSLLVEAMEHGSLQRCENCGQAMKPTGRQRYCSDACKMAAYRKRQKEKQARGRR